MANIKVIRVKRRVKKVKDQQVAEVLGEGQRGQPADEVSAFHVNSVLFHVLQESIPFGKSLVAFCTVESCSNAVDYGHVCL